MLDLDIVFAFFNFNFTLHLYKVVKIEKLGLKNRGLAKVTRPLF